MGEPVRLKVVSGQRRPISAYAHPIRSKTRGNQDAQDPAVLVREEVEIFAADLKQAFVVVRVNGTNWKYREETAEIVQKATGLTVLVVPHGMEFEVMQVDNEPEPKRYESRKVGEIVTKVDPMSELDNTRWDDNHV
jgi:hypothetical protein